MDTPGFEPGAFRMRSERDTTTLRTRLTSPSHLLSYIVSIYHSYTYFQLYIEFNSFSK